MARPDTSQDITPEVLLRAYAQGIFPMAAARDDPEIHWFAPQMRGIIPLDGFHISRSLKRRLRQGGFTPRLNHDFTQTVRHCAAREETWINPQIFALYTQLHEMGFAHSFEIWADGEMIGGVYGVALGGAFFGESMFSRRTDGSKIALVLLLTHLRDCGFTLFDTQYLTPHLASLGAIEVSRLRYQQMLIKSLALSGVYIAQPAPK